MALKSGHRINPITFEEAVKQYEQFKAYRLGLIRLEPDGWFLNTSFISYADKVYDFKFKDSDVVIMTFPKCGTTWTQEIVWTIMKNPNLNNPKAKLSAMIRCPFMESDFLLHNFQKDMIAPGSFFHNAFVQAVPNGNPKDGIFLQLAEFAEEPRIIKTHLPFSLLPKDLPDTSKIVYVVRDPRDVAVSYCHHSKLLKVHDFCGTTSDFVDHFVNDTLVYSPYWKHVKEAWKRRDQPNIHFMYYEDMKANPKDEFARLAKFLNVDLTNDQLEKIVHYTSFEEMKGREEDLGTDENDFENSEIGKKDGGFFRKGKTGDYKNKLSEEDIEKINKWTMDNTRDMESEFKYKIK